MTAHRHVRLSRPAHLAQAGDVLGRAFRDAPSFVHVFPDPAERRRVVFFVHRALVGILASLGYSWAALDEADRVVAASLWTPPGAVLGIWPFVRHGLVQLPFRFGFRKVQEMMRINDVMTSLRREHGPRPHWYLDILGVDPEAQGCGVGGTRLRRDLAEFVDPTGIPAVLWTGQPRNLPFYERNGFEILQEEHFGGSDGFTQWLMARPAQGP
ncbi:MAG: GNAT family N-acetyltransferase [Deltaproteobacteria bacterium]|nr:GNAT family N-acetyltransferase [Deltaproteobacteria bacterium]MBW2255865.1 GNAT family N-acetyltransferase [Deltaproteobacteria bacterium]